MAAAVSEDMEATEDRPMQHLLLEESAFFLPPLIAEYYVNVAATLLRRGGREDRAIGANVVCLPSFRPEWALRLVGSEESGFRLLLSEPASPLWMCTDPDSVTVEDREASIGAELAGEIRRVWHHMLSRAQPAHPPEGLDGVSYHFALTGNGDVRMAGWTWSPKETTPSGRLVSLTHTLLEFVRASEAERESVLSILRDEIAWFATLA